MERRVSPDKVEAPFPHHAGKHQPSLSHNFNTDNPATVNRAVSSAQDMAHTNQIHTPQDSVDTKKDPHDSLSMVSLMEQDKKKIQLLQSNLTLEKEYNRDLNTQLTAQMELIKTQHEKLIEGENQINEMKLRLLIKFEQIKMLEDYYNKHHEDSFEK